VLPGCSDVALPSEQMPASGPDPGYNNLVANHLKAVFKDRAFYDAFVPVPEVLKLEEIAEKFSRALGDDDPIRLGDSLQTPWSCDVWRPFASVQSAELCEREQVHGRVILRWWEGKGIVSA
jgi:hypothetical protein